MHDFDFLVSCHISALTRLRFIEYSCAKTRIRTTISTAASTTSVVSKETTSTLIKVTQISSSTLQSNMPVAYAKSPSDKQADQSSHVSEYYPLVGMVCASLAFITAVVGCIVYVLVRRTAKRSERNYEAQVDTDGIDFHDGSDIVAEGQVIDVIDGNNIDGPQTTI